MNSIVLETLPELLSIHRLPASRSLAQVLATLVPEQTGNTLFATLHSQNELSIVCDSAVQIADEEVLSSGPWRAMRVVGELDFALTGVLSALAAPLASAAVSIFAISSFDTDYLLVKADALEKAVSVLKDAGYEFANNA